MPHHDPYLEADRKERRKRKKECAEFVKAFTVAAPLHLSERAKQLWSSSVPSVVRCAERRAVLQSALEALDRADAAREAVAVEGMVTMSERSGLKHLNPLVKVEREARAQFAKLWAALRLDTMEVPDPRTNDN
jgi:phage terminase small subunit